MQIIIFNDRTYSESKENFEESLFSFELNHLASDLFGYGLDSPGELESAITRAIKICQTMKIPVRRNFRPVYSYKTGALVSDWRLSDLGRKLVLLNADPENPYVARLQMELINKI